VFDTGMGMATNAYPCVDFGKRHHSLIAGRKIRCPKGSAFDARGLMLALIAANLLAIGLPIDSVRFPDLVEIYSPSLQAGLSEFSPICGAHLPGTLGASRGLCRALLLAARHFNGLSAALSGDRPVEGPLCRRLHSSPDSK
jgi:hypothetical protein